MAYYTWFTPGRRSCQWGTPLLGNYQSDNRDVIRQHGVWLRDAGVDFVIIDWSNDIFFNAWNDYQGRDDIRYLEQWTNILFEEWKQIPGAPKIAIMVGSPSDSGIYYSWDLFR